MEKQSVPKGEERATAKKLFKSSLDAHIRNPNPNGRVIFWGSDGLYAEGMPSGKITFRYRYRLPGTRKREKITLGHYPGLPISAATELHAAMRAKVALGISPLSEQKAVAAAGLGGENTFEDLARDWVQRVLRRRNKNARQDETYLRRDIIPLLGKLVPKDITQAHIWACVEKVQERGHGQAARRVRSVLKRVFDHGLGRRVIDSNPVTLIKPTDVAPAHPRSRVLTPEEIPQWIHSIETSSIGRPLKLALHLLLLVPVRKGELLAAQWKHVNLDARTWDIPKENSKNGVAIRHKLPDKALEVMSQLRELAAGNTWVLPSTRSYGKRPISASGLNSALRGVAALPKGVVIHDLRRTVRTYLTELGVPTNVAELCLNHRPKGIVRVYDVAELLEQRFDALRRWERYLQRLLLGDEVGLESPLKVKLAALLDQAVDDQALRRHVLEALMA